jgi:uncharacterized protein YndB with AHSA1/START domain
MSATDPLGTIPDATTVRFERILPAPVARVWWYLSDPEGMAAWLAKAELEPRVGGRVELHWESGDVEYGEVTRWEPEHILEYTWSAGGELSLVRYELTPYGEHAQLIVTHERLAANRLAGYAAGWDAHLAMLVAACEGAHRAFQETFELMLPIYRKRVAGLSG